MVMMKDMRMSIHLTIALILVGLIVGALPGISFCASGGEMTSKWIEGAKAEGKLTLYTTQNIQNSVTLVKKFGEKYPFIKVDFYRAATVTLLNKILGEVKAKKYSHDVIEMPAFQTYVLNKEGMYASYVSPENRAYQEGFREPEGKWTGVSSNPYLMGYNTKMVSRKDVPDSYEGFLNPMWKGKKIGFDTKEVEFFSNMLKIMGEEKGMDFFRKLVAQKLSYRQGHSLIADLVIAGEFPVGTVYVQTVEDRKKKGAKIEWVGVAPVITKFVTVGLAAHAPHPNAGKLFIDYILSREGQMVVDLCERLPIRPDIDADSIKAFKGIKLQPSDVSLAEKYNTYSKQFADVLRVP